MKKEVKILALSYSNAGLDSYILILTELKSNRKIPIIIKSHEAIQILENLENKKTHNNSNIYNLIKKITDIYNTKLKEVYIYSVLEGLFYSKLIFSDFEFECNIAEAITLSVIYNSPIKISREVFNNVSIAMNDDGTAPKEDNFVEEKNDDIENVEENDLEYLLEEAINKENYELAAKIRDKIKKR
ncbi:MAG: bifunctional nuclease family protein [Candidatus Muirbacterium halophilum]|nr:bifunctional nuclease family protein [Candidatus Muirbacterium halophilum]